MLKHGEGGLSVFVGLNGTKEELGLKADNYWIYAENNFDELYDAKLLFLFLLELALFCLLSAVFYYLPSLLNDRDKEIKMQMSKTNKSSLKVVSDI